MPAIVRFIICCMVILLTACSGQKPNYEVHACKIACQKRMDTCSQACDNNCKLCGNCAQRKMWQSYNTYRQGQSVQGAEISRELQSYRDPLQCRKITCDCVEDYQICVQACSGVIRKRLQVAPTCC